MQATIIIKSDDGTIISFIADTTFVNISSQQGNTASRIQIDANDISMLTTKNEKVGEAFIKGVSEEGKKS